MLESLREFSEKAKSFKDVIQNESQTRTVLIEPVIKILGYDTANPFEVIAEYTCDVGTKKGEKVDYALQKDNEIVMLIEAKDCKVKLTDKNITQLFRYYSVSSARVALLTNGLDYMFFTDTIKQNVMDTEPFFTFNILDFSDEDALVMKLFVNGNIDTEKIRAYAITSAFRNAFVGYFVQQATSPTNDFVSFITKNIGLSNINSTDAANLVSNELASILGDLVKIPKKEVKTTVVEKEETVKAKPSRKPLKTKKDTAKLSGLVTLSEFTSSNINGTKPQDLLIQDRHYVITGWSDGLLATILYCIDIGKDSEFIANLDGSNESNKGWICGSSEGMRSPKELKEVGLFLNNHGSAAMNMGRMKMVCTQLGLDLSEVVIDLKE